uniref:Fibronectin type-III domain-containing protein n=1 Tax=Hucho hucho TaxID=62062 RepID=A0A4W5KN53_9TELE
MDSLTLEWGPPQDNNGRLTGYTLKYQPVNNSNELGPVEEMTFPANETTITLADLKYSTRYKFYFNAKTIKGSGPTITEEAVTIMDEVRPIGPAFTNVNSSVVGEEGAVISWEYFGPDKNVYVEYIVENSKEDWTKEFVNGSSGSQTYLIKGLKPGTSYRVRVVVKDHSEATIHSTEELVITLPGEAACPERSASVYCRVGDNSISILTVPVT